MILHATNFKHWVSMCTTLHLLPQKRDEHLMQEYLRAARWLRQAPLLRIIRWHHNAPAAHNGTASRGPPHVERLPQTEQNRRGDAVVEGPTAAVRYEGTSGGSASKFACPTP